MAVAFVNGHFSRRRAIAVALAVLVFGAVAAIIAASSSGMSTSQAVANAKPPPAGPTTAIVERRPIAQTVSVRGVITSPNTLEVRVPPGVDPAAVGVLTALPVTPGATVAPGSVIAEINGRPVILLRAEGSFYRDLRFDDTGPDVIALQRALGVTDSGRFDERTQKALSDVYRSLGYEAPSGTESSPDAGEGDDPAPDAAVQPLRDALEDAELAGQDAIDAATLDVATAQDAVARGEPAEAEVTRSQRALDQAIRARDRSVARAKRDLDAAEKRVLRQALTGGAYLSRSEVVVTSEAALTVVSVPVAVGAELEPGATVAVLGNSTLEGVAYVSPLDAKNLGPGMPVSVTGVELGEELQATIVDVVREPPAQGGGGDGEADVAAGSAPGTEATAEFPMRVRVAFVAPPPATLLQVAVLLTIEVQRTEATVLAVPLVALQQVGGDDVVVTVGDGRKWVVETGLASEGWVELKEGAPPEGSEVETR
jgi:biotin carboxyl carrier protein